MKIKEIPFDCNNRFLGGDFISENNYAIINDRNQLFRNGILLDFPLSLKFDLVITRIISKNEILIIEREISPSDSIAMKPNSWVVDNKGKVDRELYFGSVNNLTSTNKYIICSYSDAQLGTKFQYANNGLVVFDLKANSLFEYYRDVSKEKRLNFIYNYAFMYESDEIVYYLAYPSFETVEFNLKNFSSKIIRSFSKSMIVSDSFWNPKAFTKKGSDWYFLTPDVTNTCSHIFVLHDDDSIEKIGECCYSNSARGIVGGLFFAPYSGLEGSQNRCQIIEL